MSMCNVPTTPGRSEQLESVQEGTWQESTASSVFSADNCQESAKISKSEKRMSRVISSVLHMDEKLS